MRPEYMEMKSIYEHAKYLANKWHKDVSRLPKPSSVSKELDLLQLKIFALCTKLPADELRALQPYLLLCQNACKNLHLESFTRANWEILIRSNGSELLELVSAGNSNIRMQGLILSWLTRKSPSSAKLIDTLLDNTADKIYGVEYSFGLAQWLAKEHHGLNDFTQYATQYRPSDASFAEQYKERLEELLNQSTASLCGWLIEIESNIWQSLYDDCIETPKPAEQLNLAFSKIRARIES